MASPGLDFTKLKANLEMSVVKVAMAPASAVTGLTNIHAPSATELNNTGGTSQMFVANPAISWEDWSLGVEASETTNQPSMADTSTYEEFTLSNVGGDVSFFRPSDPQSATDPLALAYQATRQPGDAVDYAVRIDGDKAYNTPFANGDYIHAYEMEVASETNPFTPGESARRTVGHSNRDDFAHYTVVGPHTLTAVVPATDPWDAGRKARLRVTVQGRDYTNAVEFSSSDATVVDISLKGGGYEVTGVAGDAATITINDVLAGTSTTVAVTVTAP